MQNTTHNSLCNKSTSNYYYSKGVCKCLFLRCVCDILNAVLHLARDVRHFVCVCVGGGGGHFNSMEEITFNSTINII